MRKLAEAEKKETAPEILEKLRLAVKGRNSRVVSLEKKLAELKAHQEKGTVPTVVFGGHRLWRKVCKGRASSEEWRVARRSRLCSRGDETKGGNPNVKVWHAGGAFRLTVTISHLSEQIGVDALARPVMARAPRVEGRLWLPEKYRSLVRIWLAMRLPYAGELSGTLDGRLLVHLTFSLAGAPEPDLHKGCLALDINPDGVALSNVGRTGQPESWPPAFEIPYPPNLGKYEGEFQVILHPNGFACVRIPDLEHARGFRRKYLIGVLAKAIVDAAKFLGKPIVLEDLDFGKDRLDTNPEFNRMASNFPYAQVAEAVCRRAAKEKVAFRLVPPRHTSTIGYWKYMRRFAVPVHCAAALVIGRRAMGYRERVTRELKQQLARLKQNLAQRVRPDMPREGKGMTRGVDEQFCRAGVGAPRQAGGGEIARGRALLERLERKAQVHNGLAPWQQTRFYSAWRDFKLLTLRWANFAKMTLS